MRVRNRILGIGCALAVSGAMVPVAGAAPVTFTFHGTITGVYDETGAVSPLVSVGTPFSGSFTFESTVTDFNPVEGLAQYWSSGSGFGYQFTAGGLSASVEDVLHIVVENDRPQDSYGVNDQQDVQPNITIPNASLMRSSLFLSDSSGTVFGSESLPLEPPAASAFDYRAFSFTAFSEGGGAPIVAIEGTITALPEPGGLAMMALAGPFLLYRRRR